MAQARQPDEMGVPAPTLGTNTPSELGTSITTVEKATNRLLPGTVTAALASTGLDRKTLTRAAHLVAKSFDLDPAYFWGTSIIKDPYTGGPLSLATFRRLTEDMKPSVLEAMSPALFKPSSTDERVNERPWLTNMNAQRVSQVIREAGPVLAPFHIAAHEGIALAAEILKRGANPKRFAANLKAVLSWYAVDKNTLMKGRELDWVALANLALEAAAAKRDLTTAMDVRAFMFPEIAEKARMGSRAEANAAAAESNAMYAGRGTAWLNEATDLTPVARAFLAGDYQNPEVKKFLDERFGSAEELAKAREVLVKQALIEKAREAAKQGNVQVAGLTGGRGGVNIPDADGLAEAKELLSRSSPDWFKGAELLQQEVIDSKTAFQRSFVGGAIMKGIEALGWLNEQQQRLVINAAALSVPVLRALGENEMADDYATTYAQYLQRVGQGHGIFQTMAEKYGWHPAVGAGLDFVSAIATDPFIWGGRALTGYRSLRYAPGLVEKRGLVRSLLAKIPGVEKFLTKRSVAALREQAIDFETVARGFSNKNAKRLAEAFASGDPQKVREFVQDFGTHIHTGAALDESILQKAQRIFRERYSMVSKESIDEAEHVLQSLFGIKVRPGSLAEQAWMTRATAESEALAAVDELPLFPPSRMEQETGLFLDNATPKDLVDDAIRQHVFNPGQLEVPYRLRPIPGFGLKRSLKNALRNSELVNESGIVGAAERKMAQLFGLNPGNVLNLNEDPARWARLAATRSGEFTPREVDSIVDAMNKAAIGGNPEVAVERVVRERIIDPVMKAEAARMNLPDELLPLVKDEMERAFGKWRQELFGVVDGKNVSTPLLETQRVNELVFPDVLQVKKFVRTVANAHLDLLESAPNALRIYATRSSALWAKHVGPVLRSIMRTWKTLVVPRGGYVGRVVLLDEGLGRWFGTGFSLMERAASTNVDEAVASLVKAGTLGLTPKPIAGAVGKVIGKPIEAASDWLYYVDEFQFGDDVVRLEVPRTSIGYEPLANTVSRQSDVIEDVMKRAAQVQKDLKFRGQWGIVEPNNTTYYPALQHALNNQIGQSIPGRIALEAVRDGKTVAQTQELLIAWAKGNGKSYLAQMGWAADDVAEWAELTSKLVHGYTLGRKEIASIALERGITEDILRKIPREGLPSVHGPLLQEATFGGGNQLTRVTEYWYDTFVRLPENTLNRQPYYRAWKRRAERAYYAVAEAQYGKGAVPLEQLKAAIDQASRDFALKQVKRIMFDFSENSRLGEVLYGVFPFLQPYMEAFSVYGHILWHRNPALLAYANRLWDAGRESGFITKDEQSGEWVIPTSWWSAGSTVLQTWANVPGAELFTPVRSLNLFASSTVRLPDDVPGIGGASLPVPSVPPWVLYIAQKAFKDTDSDILSSYLFAYGPNVQVVPNALNRFLIASFPEMYDEGLLNSIAMDYLIDYQYRGIYQDLDPEHQRDQAMKDARNHMLSRSFLAFNGIGTTLVRWEWSAIRQEYFDLVEKYDGNTLKAREEFLAKYPDYTAMTVGKTEVGPGVSFLDENGTVIPNSVGLRLPATDYARRFLNSPAGKELVAKGFTPLIGALLLQTETQQENDFATYSQYLSQGLVKTKDLIEYIADIEQVGSPGKLPRVVEEHEGFWGAIISWNEWKRAEQDRLNALGFTDESNEVKALDRDEDKFLLSVKAHFPASFKQYLRVSKDGTEVSWQYGTNGSGEPDPVTFAKIRQFAELPQIQNFAAVKGLNVYFQEFDRIRERMIQEGIDSIDDTGAKDLGLDKQYEALLTKLDEQYPEASYIVKTFLRNALSSETTAGERTLAGWQEANDPRYQQYREFDAKYAQLRDSLNPSDLDYEQSFAYTQMSDLVNQEYLRNPEIIKAWWERKPYYEREQYKDNLLTKYVGYMNAWELHLLGFDVNATTAEQLRSVAIRRVAVEGAAYQAKKQRIKFDAREAYDAIQRDELVFASKNPQYAAILNAQRTWGWALEQSDYVKGEELPAVLWRNFLTALRGVQQTATKQELTGTVYASESNKSTYIRLREVLIAIKKAYYEKSDEFAKQWEYLDDQVSGPLINYFMPDYYFDYPLGPVSPRQAA